MDILSVPLFCSPNVLLDAELRAVVADFGFVSALPETVGSTTVVTAAGGALSLVRYQIADDHETSYVVGTKYSRVRDREIKL